MWRQRGRGTWRRVYLGTSRTISSARTLQQRAKLPHRLIHKQKSIQWRGHNKQSKESLTCGHATARLRILDLYPHVKQWKLAQDHYNSSDQNDPCESLWVPPEDSDQVRNNQNERDERREPFRTIWLHHCHCLHHVAQTGSKDHSFTTKKHYFLVRLRAV